MDKNKILELLARKMAGEATPLELEELNELMAKYPDSIYYDEILGQLWSGATKPYFLEPDFEDTFQRHHQKYQKEFSGPEKMRVSRLQKYKTQINVSIVLCLVLIASLFLFNEDEKISSSIQIVAGKGMRKKITLPDSTIVWLNSDSKLSYRIDLDKHKERIVYLTGEAFFDVSHYKNLPFIVRTKKLSIKVLGTTFNVKDYPCDRRSEATLINGSIELSVNDRSYQKIILNPSEKFALVQKKSKPIAKNGGSKVTQDITLLIENIEPVEIGNQVYIKETSWKDSKLVFKNETFEELKPKLERWFNVQIHLNAPKTKSFRFTGVLKNENIKEALEAMQLIKQFNFKLGEHDVIIY